MQVMGMQIYINSTDGREWAIMDIFKEGSDLVIDVAEAPDYDNFANDMPIISLADLEDRSLPDRRSFTDCTDYKGEHTTESFVIDFDHWIDEVSKHDLIDMLIKDIVKAIDDAIENKVL